MLELFIDLFRGLPRFAPGSDQLTVAALSALGAPEPGGLIADMGCGEGSSTLVLAEHTDCRIVAIDSAPDYVTSLQATLERAGLSQRVHVVEADFTDAPLQPGSVDLIWAEGSIYNLGFEAGLSAWKGFLAPAGGVAVSELTWLQRPPGPKAAEFFAEAYPAMTTVGDNLAAMERAGFEVLEPLIFPSSAWEEEFYQPLERSFEPFLARHGDTAQAREVVAMVAAEIATYRECGDCYSYVFYLGRAR